MGFGAGGFGGGGVGAGGMGQQQAMGEAANLVKELVETERKYIQELEVLHVRLPPPPPPRLPLRACLQAY